MKAPLAAISDSHRVWCIILAFSAQPPGRQFLGWRDRCLKRNGRSGRRGRVDGYCSKSRRGYSQSLPFVKPRAALHQKPCRHRRARPRFRACWPGRSPADHIRGFRSLRAGFDIDEKRPLKTDSLPSFSNDRQVEFSSGAARLAGGPRVISYQRARTPTKAVIPCVS